MIIGFRQLLRFSGALGLTVTAATAVPPARGDGLAVVKGELRQWHKVTLDLAGPFALEIDSAPNPFTDYRLTVTFTHESGNPRYAVPGYFAADGNAGETGADAGNAPTAFSRVLESGGAILPKRDPVDLRIVNNVKNRTGRITKSQDAVGGWPVLQSAPAPQDTDRDGMPDTWEIAHGSNPQDPTDGNKVGSDGYTMLERFLH